MTDSDMYKLVLHAQDLRLFDAEAFIRILIFVGDFQLLVLFLLKLASILLFDLRAGLHLLQSADVRYI